MRPLGVASALALSLVLVTATPRAEAAGADPTEQARDAFERARSAFEQKRFALAAMLFEESAGHVLHPAPLVNAADAWERGGSFVRSAQACDRVLALPSLEPEVRAQVETRLARVLSRVATLELEGPPGASGRVDEGPQELLPLRTRVTPGPHRVEATLRGGRPRPFRIVFDPNVITRRVLTEADLTAASVPEAPRVEAPAGQHRGPPVLTYVAYGSAAAALGAGIYFGASALDARSRWVDTGMADARSDFYRDRALTNVAFGVALVGAVVGTIVWLRDAR